MGPYENIFYVLMKKGGSSASFTLAEISNIFVKPDEQ
jgi:hypothetical protein